MDGFRSGASQAIAPRLDGAPVSRAYSTTKHKELNGWVR